MNWKTLPNHLKIISASNVVIDSVGDGFHCLEHERLHFVGALTRPPQETLPVLHASLVATPVASTPGDEEWVYQFHGSLVYQFPRLDEETYARGHQLFLDLTSLLDQRCGCEIIGGPGNGSLTGWTPSI